LDTVSFIGKVYWLCTVLCFATKSYKVIASEIDTAKTNQTKNGGNNSHLLYTSLQELD
jgi:hypothetical protein